jgi:hypothetical protein
MIFVTDDTVLFVGMLTGSTSEKCGNYQETSGDVQTTGTAHWIKQILAQLSQLIRFVWLLNLQLS